MENIYLRNDQKMVCGLFKRYFPNKCN